jgi:hypothetical protein
VKLFAQIKNVRREGRKSDKKDNEKQRFPFMKRSRSIHERFSSHSFETASESPVLSRVINVLLLTVQPPETGKVFANSADNE